MAKKMKKVPKKEKKVQNQQYLGYNWISMRSGLIVVSILSVGLTILIAKTTVPAIGWGEGLLWAIGFGAAIWVVFFGYYLFNRLVRNKRN
jgi:hypothetical protein